MKEPDISRKLSHFLKTIRIYFKNAKNTSDKIGLHRQINSFAIQNVFNI